MKKLILLIVGLIVLVTVPVLAYKNNQVLKFDYVFGQYEDSIGMFMLYAFVAGAVAMLIFFALTGLAWKLKAKSLDRQVDELLKQRKRDEITEQFKAEKVAETNSTLPAETTA